MRLSVGLQEVKVSEVCPWCANTSHKTVDRNWSGSCDMTHERERDSKSRKKVWEDTPSSKVLAPILYEDIDNGDAVWRVTDEHMACTSPVGVENAPTSETFERRLCCARPRRAKEASMSSRRNFLQSLWLQRSWKMVIY